MMEVFSEKETVKRSQLIKKVFKEHSSELDHYETENIITYCVK